MRSLLLVGLTVTILGITAGILWADIPGPGPRPNRFRHLQSVPQMAAVPPPNAWRIQIEVSKVVSKPRLVLPRSALERVLERTETKKETVGFGPQLDHLLFAFLLAVVGLYLLRGRTRVVFATGLMALIGITLGSQHARLEASPPVAEKKLRLGELLLEDVEIVVKPDQDVVTLTLPPSILSRLRTKNLQSTPH